MKIETKNNNPVAVAALLCVLVGSIAGTFWQLRKVSASTGAAPVVTPTPANAPSAGAPTTSPSAGATVITEGFPRPSSEARREETSSGGVADPFDHPALRRTAPNSEGTRSGVGEGRTERRLFPFPVLPGGALRTPAGVSTAGGGADKLPMAAASAKTAPAAVRALDDNPAGPDRDQVLFDSLKLTAILGAGPTATLSAVIEAREGIATPRPPVVVQAGDLVHALLRVVAITAREVVLQSAGDSGRFWTLPLADGPATDALATPPPAAPSSSQSTPENVPHATR